MGNSSLPKYVPRAQYITPNNGAQPPNDGRPLEPAAKDEKEDEKESSKASTAFLTADGKPPNGGRPIATSVMKTEEEKKPDIKSRVVTTNGRSPNQGLPTYVPASQVPKKEEKKSEIKDHVPAPGTSTKKEEKKKVDVKDHVITRDGRAPNRGLPAYIPASQMPKKEEKKSEPKAHFVLPAGATPNQGLPVYTPTPASVKEDKKKETGPREHIIVPNGTAPNGGRPLTSSAPKDDKEAKKKEPVRHVTMNGLPPAGGVPPGVRFPVYQPAPAAQSAAPTPPRDPGKDVAGPPNAQLGDAQISNLPHGAVGILHPRGGYCTLALFPKGANANEQQMSTFWPATRYLVHPNTVINDLIGGLYGGEEEEAAKVVGVVEYALVDGELFQTISQFKLDEVKSGARLYEVGWTAERDGNNPVYLSWGVLE